MQKEEHSLDTRRFVRALKQGKWYFLAIIILFTTIGCWLGFRGLPKFEIKGSMLIGEIGYDSEKSSGGMAQIMKTFSVGGFSGSSVDNEVIIMQSHDVMLRTVRTLGLNRTYIGKDNNGKKTMLYRDMPVRVEAPAEYFDTLSEAFTIKIKLLDGGKADIKAEKGILSTTIAEANGVSLPFMLDTPYGTLNIMPTDLFETSKYRTLTVNISGNEAAAIYIDKQLLIDVASKLADVIDIELDYANAELGKAIVNGVMNEYNAKRLERLHESSIASIKYYDDRIAETFKILQEKEKEVSDYQRKNELMGIDSELGLLVGDAVSNRTAIRNANYNIAYYETVLNILRNRLDDDVIIPQMESLNDPNIGAFNGLIQARRELRRSATDDNEAMKQLNEKIEETRNLIIENSTKMIAKAKADVQHQQALQTTAQGRLDQFPDYQLEFMNLMRDKEYQNQLYQYLVGQRENSVLQLYSSTNIGYIFQPAFVVKASGLLKKLIWPAVMIILALFGIICIATLMLLLSRKVNDPMDVAFIKLDNHTVKYSGSRDDINRLRTMIMAHPENRAIYFASMPGAEEMQQQFIESLTAAGRNVELLDAFADNDNLLTPDTQQRIAEGLLSLDYVVVSAPQPQSVSVLENLIDTNGSILIMSLPSASIGRKQLKRILHGQTTNKVYLLIA